MMTQRLRNRLYNDKHIIADVLRLDLLHPVVSGNKWFKLKYYINDALAGGKKGLLSFGGAFSNHLVALSYSCRQHGLESVGIIRGEDDPSNNSLLQMRDNGMQLIFVSRHDYRNKNNLAEKFGTSDFITVPEGGAGSTGIKGAAEILQYVHEGYSHILCAVGTGTTMAGLINASRSQQQLIGIPVLKIRDAHNSGLQQMLNASTNKKNFALLYDFHFGGYAKKTPALLQFMNSFYEEENIPTDFVYTAKLFYAFQWLTQHDYFSTGSSVLVIHSGGLQGNRSLPPGTLNF